MYFAMFLKKTTRVDIDILNKWLHKDYIQNFFGDPSDWTDEIRENLNVKWIQYFMVHTDKPIGFVQYYETHRGPKGIWSNEPLGTVGIDYLIGEESYLNKGYGSKLIKALIKEIRMSRKYSSVIANPNTENIASVCALVSNGFILQRNSLYRLAIN